MIPEVFSSSSNIQFLNIEEHPQIPKESLNTRIVETPNFDSIHADDYFITRPCELFSQDRIFCIPHQFSARELIKRSNHHLMVQVALLGIAFCFVYGSYRATVILFLENEQLVALDYVLVFLFMSVGALIPQYILPFMKAKTVIVSGHLVVVITLPFHYFVGDHAFVTPICAVFIGIAISLAWICASFYVARMVTIQTTVSGCQLTKQMACYFGFFVAIFRSYNLLLNIILLYALSNEEAQELIELHTNLTDCGAIRVLSVSKNDETRKYLTYYNVPHISLIILLFIGIGSVLIVALNITSISSLTKSKLGDEPVVEKKFCFVLRLIKNRMMLALVPVNFYSGFERAFFRTDFQVNYTYCAYNEYNALGMAALGEFFAMQSGLLSVIFTEVFGLNGLSICAVLGHFGCSIFLSMVPPVQENILSYYVASSVWSFSSGILDTVDRAQLGKLFGGQEIASFGNHEFWYATGAYLCTLLGAFNLRSQHKLMVAAFWQIVSIIGLLYVHHIEIETTEHASKNLGIPLCDDSGQEILVQNNITLLEETAISSTVSTVNLHHILRLRRKYTDMMLQAYPDRGEHTYNSSVTMTSGEYFLGHKSESKVFTPKDDNDQ